MKILFLQDTKDPSEWREHRYIRLDDLLDDLQRRGIFVGSKVEIGNFSYLGCEASIHAGASLGEGVTVDPRAIIGRNARIGDGTVISSHAVVGPSCRLGREVFLADGAFLQGDDILGDEVQIGARTRIALGVSIGSRTVISDDNRIGGNLPAMIGCGVWIGASNTIRSCRIGQGSCLGRFNIIAQGKELPPAANIGSFTYVDGDDRSWRNSSVEVSEITDRQYRLRRIFDEIGFQRLRNNSDEEDNRQGNQNE